MPSKSVIYYAEHPAAAQRHRDQQKKAAMDKYWGDEEYRHQKRTKALERYYRLKQLKLEQLAAETEPAPTPTEA
tara:strand:- start:253 stop:474 length:222 start_codon:yes stop_codon:yes gene_type:complete